jgi:hypothetical protein
MMRFSPPYLLWTKAVHLGFFRFSGVITDFSADFPGRYFKVSRRG